MTVFSFRPGSSRIHKLDVRFKLLFLILISLASLRADIYGLLLLFGCFAGIIFYLGISFYALLKAVRYYLLLLGFVFAARALSTPGEPLMQFAGFTVSYEGLHQGGQICLRLFFLVLLGLAFIVTSRPSEVRAAVAWFLKPVPGINGDRVATMLGLVLRFIPLIFNQAAKTGDAQRARGVENRKNPVYRLRRFVLPFMRRTFEDADRLAIAMEARAYSEVRTSRGFSVGKPDWIAAVAVLLLCALAGLL